MKSLCLDSNSNKARVQQRHPAIWYVNRKTFYCSPAGKGNTEEQVRGAIKAAEAVCPEALCMHHNMAAEGLKGKQQHKHGS